MQSRLHAFISGRVQGVFYRYWCKEQAERLELAGWVRNLGDGRVEIVVEGAKENLQNLVQLIKKGPPLAQVSHLDIVWEEATKEFSEFSIV